MRPTSLLVGPSNTQLLLQDAGLLTLVPCLVRMRRQAAPRRLPFTKLGRLSHWVYPKLPTVDADWQVGIESAKEHHQLSDRHAQPRPEYGEKAYTANAAQNRQQERGTMCNLLV